MFLHVPNRKKHPAGSLGAFIKCPCGYSGQSIWTHAGTQVCPFCHRGTDIWTGRGKNAIGPILAALAAMAAVITTILMDGS